MTATLLGNIKGPKGDTGKGIQSITKTGTSGLVDTYTITYTNGDTTTYTLTNAPSPGTFTDLQTLITNASSGDTIVLDKDYKYNSTTDSSLTNGIVINKTITIIGNGHIIDGNNTKRAFYCNGNYTLELNDLKIQNCTGSSGGAIDAMNNSQVNINNTTLNNNTADNGGAIHAIWNSQINMNNTNINNNNATNYGGAIYVWSNSQLTIKESIIKNNTATNNYANIYCSTATTVYNCDINDISTTCYNVTNKNYLTDHQSIPSASTNAAGTVQLEDSYSSTSTTKAPTSNALKEGLATKSDSGHTHNYASISDIDVEIEAYLDAIIDALEEADIIGGIGGSSIDISTQWSTLLSDSKVPSEKLVKESLDTKANSSSIPTKTSDLTNDSGYVTSSGSTVSYSQTQSSGTNTYTIGKITINGTETTLYGKDTNTTYTIPSASTSTPAKDTASGTYGSGTTYARANHAHPKSSIYAEAEHEHDTDDINGLINLIYPVGSIYITVNSTSPAVLFGGSWTQLTNTFLYASTTADTNATTAPSGQGEATHTLTVNEMPAHQHDSQLRYHHYNANGSSHNRSTWEEGPNNSVDDFMTGWAGGGAAHNNMPPYMKVYMWKRTG